LLLLFVAIIALLANTFRIRSELTTLGHQNFENERKIILLQVRLMDRVLAGQDGLDLTKLLAYRKK